MTPTEELMSIAKQVDETAHSWNEFHNAIFGIGGPFGRLFPTVAERTRFAGTEEFKQICAMIDAKATPTVIENTDHSPSNELRIPLPVSLHNALLAEAEREQVTLEQLVLAKLAVSLGEVIHFSQE